MVGRHGRRRRRRLPRLPQRHAGGDQHRDDVQQHRPDRGTAYSYTVAAYDPAGNVSPQSTSVNATTPAGTTPQTLTFAAVADATVRSGHARHELRRRDHPRGRQQPGAGPPGEFTVTVPAGKTVTSAKLRLYDVEASVKGGDVYRTAEHRRGPKEP